MLLHHPEIIHPESPFLAIGGPWILPNRTGSTLLSIAKALPRPIISNTDKLARLINNHLGPFIGNTIGLSAGLVSSLLPRKKAKPPAAPREDEAAEVGSAEFEAQLWSPIIDRIYAEGVAGISSDAVLFLQKGMDGWSDWGDYDTGVARLAEVLRAAGKRLRVDVFYPSSDFFVGGEGDKGPRWFNRCWEAASDVIHFQSSTVKGADHDGIWMLKFGVPQSVFETIESLGEERRVQAAGSGSL